LLDNLPYLIPGTVATIVVLTMAFINVGFAAKAKLSISRRDAVSLTSLGLKVGKTGKEEKKKILSETRKQQDEITTKESLSFSILYNTFFFLVFLVFLSSYLLVALPVFLNYLLSIGASLFLVLYSSRGK